MKPGVWKRGSRSNGSGGNNCVEVQWLVGNCVGVDFQKSTLSSTNGTCVEVGFRKSGYCADGACVEVGMFKKASGCGTSTCVEAGPHEDMILVRDSKQNGKEDQPILRYTRSEWDAFIKGVKAGEFDFEDPQV